MLSPTITLISHTVDKYGYDPSLIGRYAQKNIVVQCTHCKLIFDKPKREEANKHRCPQIVDGKKYCVCCKEQKDPKEFAPSNATIDKLKRICRICTRTYESNNKEKLYQQKLLRRKSNLRSFLAVRLGTSKSRAIKKQMQFDLDLNFLEELFLKQEGKCYYSGVQLNLDNNACRHDSLSTDRLDPSKGYTKDNVVFCTFNINSLKGTMNEQEFKDYLKLAIPLLQVYATK